MRKDGRGLVARGHQQTTAARQDMRKDGTGLVAWGHHQTAGLQETEDNKDPMETSEDNDSDLTYHGSTDSMKGH
jgi:hypothetical protein